MILFSLISFGIFNTYAQCDPEFDWDTEWDVWTALDDCLDNSSLIDPGNSDVESWLWVKIKSWTDNIALYLWLFAVWSIVIWWLMMTLSTWEDEKIKKAKDMVKWGIIWFLAIIFASAVVNLVVKIMYSI